MNISVRKINNNIDLKNLSTNLKDEAPNNEPELGDTIELPELDYKTENVEDDEPEYEKLDYDKIDEEFDKPIEKKQETDFLGTVNKDKKPLAITGDYCKFIYFGLGFTLLAQFL